LFIVTVLAVMPAYLREKLFAKLVVLTNTVYEITGVPPS